MSPDSHSLILGVAGMISTLLVAALGLYFTARARSAPMRQILYTRQLDLAQRFFRVFGRARVFAVLLTPEGQYRDRARVDLGALAKRLSILTDEAAALFPAELYVAVKKVSDAVISVVDDYDHGRETQGNLDLLSGQEAKAALMVRALLGVDELSDESIRLFSKSDNLTKLGQTNPDDFLAESGGEEPV
jgi:hypothetical protein